MDQKIDQMLWNLLDDDEDEEAIVLVLDVMLEDYLEEDSASSRINVCVDLYAWRTLEDPNFLHYFRMKRSVIEKLVICVGEQLERTDRLRRIKTPLDLSVIIALWILTNGDTFRSTAAHFDVSNGVVFYHYLRFITVLNELRGRFIKWPSTRERDNIKDFFDDKYNYPGCIGAIDGTHLYITAPLVQPRHYINRHHAFSILAQTVCDHKKRYRDVYVGEPGSVGDIRIFQRSSLYRNMYRIQGMIKEDEHLIGDQAYPLSDKVQIPYPQDTLHQIQRHHNRYISASRSVVERSYELLKEKFPRLRRFRSYSLWIAIRHIMTCYILHNFILLDGNEMDAADIVMDMEDDNVPVDEAEIAESRILGAVKREYICHLLANNM